MAHQRFARFSVTPAMLRAQVSVQVGSLTVQAAVRDLEPLQGRQPAGSSAASSGKRQQPKTARKRKNGKDARREQEQQEQQREQQGGVATVQSSANTVDVRGQRALEVRMQSWCERSNPDVCGCAIRLHCRWSC
jgi:hypothetical protein